jgi:hypothetical protein
MARVTYVKKAQQRYRTVPVIDPETGEQATTPVLRKDGTPKTTKAGRPIVQRRTVADKAQPLPMPRCGKCGAEIAVGAPYKHVSPKSGPYGGRTLYRCGTCPSWRPSELTSSSIKASVYAAQEQYEDAGPFDSIDAIKDALSGVADGYREAAEQARESASNIEDGFGHATSQSEELEQRADDLEGLADELDSWEPDEIDEDAIRAEVTEGWDPVAGGDIDELVQEKLEEALEAAADEANDLVYSCDE